MPECKITDLLSWIECHPGTAAWMNFLAAVLLVGVTIALVIVGLRQIRDAKRAIATLERPELFVEAERARWHTSHIPNIPFVEYKIHNYGRAAAVIKSRKINAVVVETIPRVPPCNTAQAMFDWTSIVANGAIKDLTETIERNDDTDKLERVRERARVLIFSGIIEYEDAVGKKFTTQFGWIFDPSNAAIPHSNERFIACATPGYNVNT